MDGDKPYTRSSKIDKMTQRQGGCTLRCPWRVSMGRKCKDVWGEAAAGWGPGAKCGERQWGLTRRAREAAACGEGQSRGVGGSWRQEAQEVGGRGGVVR